MKGLTLGLWLGCSGWSYEEWVGPFYPDKEKKFSYYSKIFKTVEIDSTFYKYPSPGMVIGLARSSPKDFVFTAKFPKLITHDKKLEPSEQLREDTERFLQLMRPLNTARKLGALLLQLPPFFRFKSFEKLATFIEMLPTDFRYAVEFRNPSWFKEETWSLLRKHDIAYTIVDEPLLPPDAHITTDFSYIRWHGHGASPWFNYRYEDEQLQEWVPKIKEICKRTKETYGMFNNHFHGYAPENCLRIMEMLGVATQEQSSTRKRITDYIEGIKKLRIPEAKTEALHPRTRKDKLISPLMDPKRLERAREIPNEEVVLEEKTNSILKGRVRDYTISIDCASKTIEHDCDDWSKGLGEKRICKHLGAFLLFIPDEIAYKILKSLSLEKERWEFKMAESR
ncbi:MAG: DUF72 domain-containing protein [Thermoproteota archaeon]